MIKKLLGMIEKCGRQVCRCEMMWKEDRCGGVCRTGMVEEMGGQHVNNTSLPSSHMHPYIHAYIHTNIHT